MAGRASGQAPGVAIEFISAPLADIDVDTIVVTVPPDGQDWTAGATIVDGELDGLLKAALADASFSGKAGSTFLLPTPGQLKARRVIVTGLPAGEIGDEAVRAAFGSAARAATAAKSASVACIVPVVGTGDTNMYRAATEGFLLGLYKFGSYRSAESGADVERLVFVGDETPEASDGVRIGQAMAAGVYLARDMVFEPGNTIYPESLAEVARETARNVELEYEVFDEKQLAEMGAGAIVAVGQGSEHLPRLVRMTYTPSGESKATIALVGKGITFDTGGMSLKTGEGMVPMKTDMAGSAAVLGAMRAVAELDLPITVHGIIAAAENMPSDTAYRPSDVLKAMNGKTIEVISTDAEGRLVLADALVYAAGLGSEVMIDLATLTGAKVVALGEESVAVFSNDDDLADAIVAAADESGEQFWHMPLWDSMRSQLDSEIADMKNTGGRAGGAITAALFLSEFAEGKRWAHLDIAGAAWAKSARGYTPKGATGVGVRTLVTYLERLAAS
ncbi:MAG: leucyl aminopeptidase [Thermomicrobiales bacterium]